MPSRLHGQWWLPHSWNVPSAAPDERTAQPHLGGGEEDDGEVTRNRQEWTLEGADQDQPDEPQSRESAGQPDRQRAQEWAVEVEQGGILPGEDREDEGLGEEE